MSRDGVDGDVELMPSGHEELPHLTPPGSVLPVSPDGLHSEGKVAETSPAEVELPTPEDRAVKSDEGEEVEEPDAEEGEEDEESLFEDDTPVERGGVVVGQGQRHCKYTYETQRWFPILGWGAKRLPTDIPEWVDDKRKALPRDKVELPEGCMWSSDWFIDDTVGDADGWEYTGDWWWQYHTPQRKGDCVRRRRWKREYELPTPGQARRPTSTPSTQSAASAAPDTLERAGKSFHRLFPVLPSTERLVDDFQCNYVKGNLHRVGRLYVTHAHVCFHSMMCNPLIIPFANFAKVEKKSTWGLLEAIRIHSVDKGDGGEKTKEVHTFTAFVSRETAYNLILQLFSLYQRKLREMDSKSPSPHPETEGDDGQKERTTPVSPTSPTSPPATLPTSPAEDLADNDEQREACEDHPLVDDVDARKEAPSDADVGVVPSTPPQAPVEEDVESESPKGAKMPRFYRVVGGSATRPGAVVREGVTTGSKMVGKLGFGTLVEAVEAKGRRVRIRSPMAGWVSVCSKEGVVILEPHSAPAASPSKEAKNADLARSFADFGAGGERLVQHFQCSYKAKNYIDRLGRLYLTDTRILFTSPVMTNGLSIPYTSIVDVVKKKDLLVLNAIVVVTNDDSFIFTAFMQRDQTFSVLHTLWSVHLRGEGKDPEAIQRAAREKREQRKTGSPVKKAPRSMASVAETGGVVVKRGPPTSFPPLSDVAGQFAADHPFTPEHTFTGKQLHDPVPLPPALRLPDVFEALFGEGSTFLEEYHTSRGEYMGPRSAPTGCVMPRWEWEEGDTIPTSSYRSFECTTIVAAPFNKHVRYVEQQRYSFCTFDPDQPGLIFHVSSQTPDVMTGDCFRIEAVVEFRQGSAGIEMSVRAAVVFLKQTMLKGKIESKAMSDLTASYRAFLDLAMQHCNSYQPGAAPKPRPAVPVPVVPPPAPSPFSFANAMLLLRVVSAAVPLWAFWQIWGVVVLAGETVQHYADMTSALADAMQCAAAPVCNSTAAGEMLSRTLQAAGGGPALLALSRGTTDLSVAYMQLIISLVLCILLAAVLAVLLVRR